MRITTLIALASIALVPPLAAQDPVWGPRASVLLLPAPPRPPIFPLHLSGPAPTYWQEGALIGGLLGALGGALLGNGLCTDADTPGQSCTFSTVGGGVLGAVILGVPAALIGGAFSKHRRATPPEWP